MARGHHMATFLRHLLLMTVIVAAVPAAAVDEDAVQAVAARLRCVVCQNLSVADSPSEMAQQMRSIVRDRLASGETPEQVTAYFVDRYGEWILLTPTVQGFNLLVWTMPAVAVVAGLIIVAFLLRRWTRPRRTERIEPLDPALRERLRSDMETNP